MAASRHQADSVWWFTLSFWIDPAVNDYTEEVTSNRRQDSNKHSVVPSWAKSMLMRVKVLA